MSLPCSNVEWEPPKNAKKYENGTTAYEPKLEMSLLREMMEFEDCRPTYFHGGGKVQPWVVPAYGMSAEVELADLLYCFVRLLKPQVVVETGCFMGFTTWALGRAVRDNGFGVVVSCDNDHDKACKARKRCQGLPVHVLNCSCLSPEMDEWYGKAQFAFLDADEDTRPYSLARLRSGCVVAIHDTRQEGWVEQIEQVVNRIDFIETWRGFTLMRKV